MYVKITHIHVKYKKNTCLECLINILLNWNKYLITDMSKENQYPLERNTNNNQRLYLWSKLYVWNLDNERLLLLS